MPRPPSATLPDLLALLRSGEPLPAGQLVEQLGISRPVLARLVAQAGNQILRVGKARASAYVARASNNEDNAWPLLRMRPDATLEELGTLYSLRGERFQFVANADRPNLTAPVKTIAGHFPGLPWFFDDLRPQGLLGRTLARRLGQKLGVPLDLNRWQLRDTLRAITQTGGTSSGDLLLGQPAIEAGLSELTNPPDAVLASQRGERYAEWAQAALAGEEIGSSPGGEQPKFTATIVTADERYAALVKFAVPDSGQAARRWADLLVCEHIALSCLREAGLPAAESELISAAGYTCLEVRRFDRTPNLLGRRGFISLRALDAAFIGSDARDWGLTGERLAAEHLISSATAVQMARLHWFGRLIGNSDMHPGNIGFHLTDSGPLSLAPAYDMLPMSLAPSITGAVRTAKPLQPGAPERAGQFPHIAWAAEVAEQFWEQVSAHAKIESPEMRRLATLNRDAVARFAGVLSSQQAVGVETDLLRRTDIDPHPPSSS